MSDNPSGFSTAFGEKCQGKLTITLQSTWIYANFF
jgi:hypothetical protein